MMYLIKYRWLIGGLAGLLFVTGVYFTGYMKGHHKAELQCEREKAESAAKGIKTNEKIKTKIAKLSDPDLDKRLDKWMRD